MIRKLFFFTLILFSFPMIPYSQGCSDAGFCTMGAMKPDQAYSKRTNLKLRAIELSQYRGVSTLSPTIYVTNLDFAFSVGKMVSFQVKIPYQVVTGNLGTTSALGDISLSATRNIISKENYDINATLGAKIPTNNSQLGTDANEYGTKSKHYPMYYQSSLGSFDIVAGMSIINRKWLMAIGCQSALTANSNRFDVKEWSNYPNQEYIKKHNTSTELKRGTDVMLRIERNWRFSNYNFTVGALSIYRITNDQIKNGQNQYFKVDKTVGMALTALCSAGYRFNTKSSIKLILGINIINREVNPDELTRNSVQTIAYTYNF